MRFVLPRLKALFGSRRFVDVNYRLHDRRDESDGGSLLIYLGRLLRRKRSHALHDLRSPYRERGSVLDRHPSTAIAADRMCAAGRGRSRAYPESGYTDNYTSYLTHGPEDRSASGHGYDASERLLFTGM